MPLPMFLPNCIQVPTKLPFFIGNYFLLKTMNGFLEKPVCFIDEFDENLISELISPNFSYLPLKIS